MVFRTEFVRTHPQFLAEDNSLEFISDNNGYTYNLCHSESPPCLYLILMYTSKASPSPVWSNFEIADMDFWRGEAYTAFFDFLDKSGGFYYEVRLTIPWCGLKPYDVSAVTKNWKTIGSAGATRRCTPSHWHCSYPDRSCISSSKSGTSMPRS